MEKVKEIAGGLRLSETTNTNNILDKNDRFSWKFESLMPAWIKAFVSVDAWWKLATDDILIQREVISSIVNLQ